MTVLYLTGRLLLPAFCISALVAAPAYAQQGDQSLSHSLHLTLIDQNQTPIRSAEVTVSSPTQGSSFSETTSETGTATLPVALGVAYVVTVPGMPGFQGVELPALTADNLYQTITVTHVAAQPAVVTPVIASPPITTGKIFITVVGMTVARVKHEPIWLTDYTTGEVRHDTTDASGKATFIVPAGRNYYVGIGINDRHTAAPLPAAAHAYANIEVQYEPTRVKEAIAGDTISQALPPGVKATSMRNFLWAKMLDADGAPLRNEAVYLPQTDPSATAATSSTIYRAHTDANGIARLLVPKGYEYELDLEEQKNLDQLDYRSLFGFHQTKVVYRLLSEEERAPIITERRRIVRVPARWDARYEAAERFLSACGLSCKQPILRQGEWNLQLYAGYDSVVVEYDTTYLYGDALYLEVSRKDSLYNFEPDLPSTGGGGGMPSAFSGRPTGLSYGSAAGRPMGHHLPPAAGNNQAPPLEFAPDGVPNKRARELMEQLNTNPSVLENRQLPMAAVLYRHKHAWRNKVLVTDLTRSMHHLTRELRIWFELQQQLDGSTEFVFFNDGDTRPNKLRKPGSTGGIYHLKDTTRQGLDSLMTAVRKNGSGHEPAENDLEAARYGTNYLHQQSALILVADMKSPVRDMELLPELNVPVHIILCGRSKEVHPQYLDIARATRGSLHTQQLDIVHLHELADGERFELLGRTYWLVNGHFVAQ